MVIKKCVKKIYKNPVIVIQTNKIFEFAKDAMGLSTAKKYLDISQDQLLYSRDANEICEFIIEKVTNSNVRNVLLHTSSTITESIIDTLVEKKKKSSKLRSLLSKCILVNTLSNANDTREKNRQTGSMIYFLLNDLGTILNNLPSGKFGKGKKILVAISDSATNDRYYKQINDYFVDIKKIPISKLTSKDLNDFTDGEGHTVITSLDSSKEYKMFTNLINNSRFRENLIFIENEYPEITAALQIATPAFTNLQAISSGQSITAPASRYIGLNPLLAYDRGCAVLAKGCKANILPTLIETGVL
jgi:hypothetical protein